jgi:hypothetical protein
MRTFLRTIQSRINDDDLELDSRGGCHTYDLRIDLSTDGIPAHDAHSNVVSVLVDNTAPVALLDIDLPGGADDCADYALGATITGHYTATDIHFGGFSFVIRPQGPANGHLPIPPAGSRV